MAAESKLFENHRPRGFAERNSAPPANARDPASRREAPARQVCHAPLLRNGFWAAAKKNPAAAIELNTAGLRKDCRED